MDILKTSLKTNLVQSLEEMQEVNEAFEVVAVIENYINYVNCINNSMAVPSGMLEGESEKYLTMYPEKPDLIKIDTTKLQ